MFVDTVAAIAISFGFYLGYKRGLINTVFDTLSLIIGVLAALKLSPWMMDVLEGLFNMNKGFTLILGIALTFLIVMLGIRFVGKKLEALLEVANINFVNKIAGGVIQAVFFSVMLSYLIGLMDKVNVLKEETKASSATYPTLMKMPVLSQSLFNALKPVFSEFWTKTNTVMDGLKKENQK
jgi:membrane protein required for colicin V production